MILSIIFIIILCPLVVCFTHINKSLHKLSHLLSTKSTSKVDTVNNNNINIDAQNALKWVENNINKISIFNESPTKLSLTVNEIGGGNTNFNYVVRDTTTGRAAFVKHAKAFAKGFGESAPMSTIRLGYEYYGAKTFFLLDCCLKCSMI